MNTILTFILPLTVLVWQSPKVTFEVIDTHTDATLIAMSSTAETLWLSGTNGTIMKSNDEGLTWTDNLWTGPDSLQFRDIQGLTEGKAVAMSIGTGEASQIFLTADGGKSWIRSYVMTHPDGFLDCIDFWDDQRGVAYGDSFDGYPFILRTTDGGRSWARVLPENLPKALEGEGGFASSGTCITTASGGRAWVGTGNGPSARVILTEDYGHTWKAVASPLISGEAAGITSIDFTEDGSGFITGGNLSMMEQYTDNCAVSRDYGLTWELTSSPVTKGASYGSSIASINEQDYFFVCGPNGIDYSFDDGKSWQNLDTANYWVVHFDSGRSIGWAAGKYGRLIRINIGE